MFTTAFDLGTEKSTVLAEAKAHFEEMGYVVFSNVFNHGQCLRTRNSMWKVVGLDPDDHSTWQNYKGAGALRYKSMSFHFLT